jgi:gamma-glutamyltranspeptidase/glutathione hydrolase
MSFRVRLAVSLVAVWLGSLPAGAAEHATLFVTTKGAVAAEHRLASAAGVEILDAGGNAVDAAVAATLVGAVVNPASAGLGGGGFMLVFSADEGRAHALDYREAAGASAHRDTFIRNGKVDTDASKTGGLAVGVPGEAAGVALALARFGTMTPAQVAEPALRLAREGFVVEAHLAEGLRRHHDTLAADPVLSLELLAEGGRPYEVGETMRRPGLAAALAAFASAGAAPFYTGDIAAEIVAAVQRSGGNLRASDLASYRVIQREPVLVDFQRWKVIGMPPPSSGGGTIGEALGVLGSDRLGELGHNSTTYLHLLAETLKAVFADRARYYGDPAYTKVDLAGLLAGDRLRGIRARISAHSVIPAQAYGSVIAPDDSGTAHTSVIDARGNAVACTTSINTPFGAKVGVEGAGIPLNNTMDDFSLRPGVANVYGLVGSEANAVAAGKRPLSSMAPTIVLEDGAARLAVGASGGPLIITATLQTLLDVLVFDMDVATAVSAPRIHEQWLPDRLLVESEVDESVRTGLARLGHDVTLAPFAAAVQAVEAVGEGPRRSVRAASDARKGGLAAVQ